MFKTISIYFCIHNEKELKEYKDFFLNYISQSNNIRYADFFNKHELSSINKVKTYPAYFRCLINTIKYTVSIHRTIKKVVSSIDDLRALLLINKL